MLCSKKHSSVPRDSRPDSLATFTWDKLSEEVSIVAPTFYGILQACVGVKKRHKNMRCKTYLHSNNIALGVCASIILRHCNHHMNLFQRLVSLILHSGHSGKQVYIFTFMYMHVRGFLLAICYIIHVTSSEGVHQATTTTSKSFTPAHSHILG